MAEIVHFPARTPQLRLVGSPAEEARGYERRQMVEAASAFAATIAEIAGSIAFADNGGRLDATSAVLNGETLVSALHGVLPLINLRGAAADEALVRAVRKWLAENGGHHGH